MNNRGLIRYIFLFFIISLVLIGSVIVIYMKKNVTGYTEYIIDYEVGDYAGFNLDEDAIHFGTVYPGIYSTRNIDIYADRDSIIRLYLVDLDSVYLDKNDFFLKSGESENVKLILKITNNTEKGYYSGKLKVLYFNP